MATWNYVTTLFGGGGRPARAVKKWVCPSTLDYRLPLMATTKMKQHIVGWRLFDDSVTSISGTHPLDTTDNSTKNGVWVRFNWRIEQCKVLFSPRHWGRIPTNICLIPMTMTFIHHAWRKKTVNLLSPSSRLNLRRKWTMKKHKFRICQNMQCIIFVTVVVS